MKQQYAIYIILTPICLILGSIYYALNNSLLIINTTHNSQLIERIKQASSLEKREVTIFFWKHKRWNHEVKKILWHKDPLVNLQQIITTWCTLLEEENITQHTLRIESVMSGPHRATAYVSFDRTPFDAHQSTHSKIMRLESLFKTIREASLPLQSMVLLEHHQLLKDQHLDFSHPWPISGFLNKD